MTIDITPEAVEWLAQADDAYEIGHAQSLRFAPTLRALSAALTASTDHNTRVVTVEQLEQWSRAMPEKFKSHKEIRAIIGEVK